MLILGTFITNSDIVGSSFKYGHHWYLFVQFLGCFYVIVHPQNPEPNLRCCMVLSLGSAFHQRYVFLSNRDVLGEGRPLISMSFFVAVEHGLFFFEHVSIPEINPEVD